MTNTAIRFLRAEDVASIARAFQEVSWHKPASKYQHYLREQQAGRRVVPVAFVDDEFAGYLNVVWRSDYPPFQAERIPEIQDFNVLPHVRRRGIGSRLMDEAEQLIAQRAALAGIGVGLTADYGAAQRLYIKRGYVPDGRGLMWHNRAVAYGAQVTVDDALTLHLVKSLAA